MNKQRLGQSTLEYVIILAVVIGAIITIGLALKTNITSSYNTLGTNMKTKVTGLITK